MRQLLAFVAAILWLCDAAVADEVKEALHAFGWAGRWSVDCTIPMKISGRSFSRRPNGMEMENSVPIVGPPTIKFTLHDGQVLGNPEVVLGVRQTGIDSLIVESISVHGAMSTKYIRGFTKIDERLVTTYWSTGRIADHGHASADWDLNAAESEDIIAVRDALFLAPDGRPLDEGPIWERCKN